MSFERAVERWQAAEIQGWMDYDGSTIEPSMIVEPDTYELDHVHPASFGEFRSANLFVSRHNHDKGARLPWEAFGDNERFRPVLLAFAVHGARLAAEDLEKARGKARGERLAKVLTSLERATQRLAALDAHGTPDPGVLTSLAESAKRTSVAGTQDAIDAVREVRPRGTAAPRRLRRPGRVGDRLGHKSGGALPKAPGERRCTRCPRVGCMRCVASSGVAKDRADQRNHAIDAFVIAHFDERMLSPAFAQLPKGTRYEERYNRQRLAESLCAIGDGTGGRLFGSLIGNLRALEPEIAFIATSHRANHLWTPGDPMGGGLRSFGGENLYGYRPTADEYRDVVDLAIDLGLIGKGLDTSDPKTFLRLIESLPEGRKLNPGARQDRTYVPGCRNTRQAPDCSQGEQQARS